MVYTGYTEDEIDNMSIPIFHEVLNQLGRRLRYDAVVNYAGNSFVQKSWELIEEANPLTPSKQNTGTSGAMQNLVAMLGGANMIEG